MNVSYDWLRAFVPFRETPAKLRDLITSRVATVDELVPLRQELAPIVVARVVEAGPHPDSDHLWVTKVDAGTGSLLDVVCGAPNVKQGALYPFAPTGTTMPNGLKIEKRRIRGQTSNGMLCSPRELGMGDDHEGILELSVDAAPGTPFLKVMPAGDTRLVIDVSPVRPDLLSHLGVAREIAAAVDSPLTLPHIDGADASVPSAKRVHGGGRIGSTEVRVEEDGLVRRQPHPTDGRSTLVAITEDGERYQRESWEQHQSEVAVAFGDLPVKQQEQLLIACRNLTIAFRTRLAERAQTPAGDCQPFSS